MNFLSRFLLILCFSTVIYASGNRYGVDSIASDIEVSVDCMRGANTNSSFAVFTGLVVDSKTGYVVSKNVCNSLKNAQSAGVLDREVLAFPDPNCATSCDSYAQKQIDALMNEVNNNCKSAFTGRIWLVVDNPSLWGSNTKTNRAFLESLMTAAKKYTSKFGIFSSEVNYDKIFGNVKYSYAKDQGAVAGYSSTAQQANFNDWDMVAFGGWDLPYFKRYKYSTYVDACPSTVGLDFEFN